MIESKILKSHIAPHGSVLSNELPTNAMFLEIVTLNLFAISLRFKNIFTFWAWLSTFKIILFHPLFFVIISKECILNSSSKNATCVSFNIPRTHPIPDSHWINVLNCFTGLASLFSLLLLLLLLLSFEFLGRLGSRVIRFYDELMYSSKVPNG